MITVMDEQGWRCDGMVYNNEGKQREIERYISIKSSHSDAPCTTSQVIFTEASWLCVRAWTLCLDQGKGQTHLRRLPGLREEGDWPLIVTDVPFCMSAALSGELMVVEVVGKCLLSVVRCN